MASLSNVSTSSSQTSAKKGRNQRFGSILKRLLKVERIVNN